MIRPRNIGLPVTTATYVGADSTGGISQQRSCCVSQAPVGCTYLGYVRGLWIDVNWSELYRQRSPTFSRIARELSGSGSKEYPHHPGHLRAGAEAITNVPTKHESTRGVTTTLQEYYSSHKSIKLTETAPLPRDSGTALFAGTSTPRAFLSDSKYEGSLYGSLVSIKQCKTVEIPLQFAPSGLIPQNLSPIIPSRKNP